MERGRDVTKKTGVNQYVGTSLNEWLEEEIAKDPSFAVGLNEQMEKFRELAAKAGRTDALKAPRRRRERR
jgi:hypothetical protein